MTELGGWSLILAVIRVNAYSFLTFLYLTCHLEDTGIGVFWLHYSELGSNDQEACPSASKNTRVVLVPCPAWKCVPTAISHGVDVLEVRGCHLL